MGTSPFLGPGDEPRLTECGVLYFDLLGVSAMAQGEQAEEELLRFDRTIREAFPYRLGAATGSEGESRAYPTTVFSDSVVQAVPIASDLPAASPLFQLVLEVAQLQAALAIRDYFARGAITLDKFHSYEGLIFGPALVEAVALEREVAVNPRIVISPAVSTALLTSMRSGGLGKVFAEGIPILIDEDGVPFVDYLSGALHADPGIDLTELLKAHREAVERQLDRQRSNFGRWSKHRWVAEYHNSICTEFRPLLESDGGFEHLLIDSIHTRRHFTSLVAASRRDD